MTNASNTKQKSKLNWVKKILLGFILFEASLLLTLAINDVKQVDANIKTKISQLVDIENLGHVQSVQTRHLGPFTFYKFNFFKQGSYQVSAKAMQFFGFSPQITCVSGSPSYRCQ